MAQRKIEHWKKVLKLVKNVGFEIESFNYEKGKIFSQINIASKKK